MRHLCKIPILLALSLALLNPSVGTAQDYDFRGHIKSQATLANIPADSLLQDFSDDPMRDTGLDLRLILSGARSAWTWRGDYQLLAQQGDRLELGQQYPQTGFATTSLIDDDRRRWIHHENDPHRRSIALTPGDHKPGRVINGPCRSDGSRISAKARS